MVIFHIRMHPEATAVLSIIQKLFDIHQKKSVNVYSMISPIIYHLLYVVLRIGSRVSCMLKKYSITELYGRPLFLPAGSNMMLG